MRIRSILGTLVIASLPVMPALAADMTPEEIQKMVDEAVNRKMQEHERREGAAERSMEQKEAAPQYPVPTGPMTDVRVERKGEEKVPLGFGSTGSGRLVYAKPFVAAPKAIVGGYMDIQYRSHQNGVLETGDYNDIRGGQGTTNGFDQQRFVPFIYADITEHVKFASEIEIEHGIRGAGEIEISLEFAHIDYLVNEPFNIRAGILLIPIGKFNLLHDSPLNDLTDRPLVSPVRHPIDSCQKPAQAFTAHSTREEPVNWTMSLFTTGPCGYNSDGSSACERGKRDKKYSPTEM